MQKYLKIKALFFLGVFSMFLLHQVVPHWHHQHQEENQHSEVAHSHHHDHHHEKLESDNSKKGFFDWFIEMHVHSNSTTEVLVLMQTTVKKIGKEKESAKTVLPETVNLAILEVDTSNVKWYHPPDKVPKEHFHYLSLRGPPILG